MLNARSCRTSAANPKRSGLPRTADSKDGSTDMRKEGVSRHTVDGGENRWGAKTRGTVNGCEWA